MLKKKIASVEDAKNNRYYKAEPSVAAHSRDNIDKIIREIYSFEGQYSFLNLWHDMLNTLEEGEEFLMYNVDEQLIADITGDSFYQTAEKFMSKDLKAFALSSDRLFASITPFCKYKYMGNLQDDYLPNFIYGNKSATIKKDGDGFSVVVVNNEHVTREYRKSFGVLWQQASALGGSSRMN